MTEPGVDEFQKQALTEHLADLRSCLIASLIAVAVGFALSYAVVDEIGKWFFMPLHDALPQGASVIFTSYQEAFFFYLKLALVAGVLLATPVIFYQIWRFVAPGLYQHEKKVILPFALLSSICFLGGAAFGYLVVFPPAFKFLTSYANDFLSPLPTVKEYFSLSLRLLIAFGVIFELPVFMVLLAKLGVVNSPFLSKYRRYAFLLAFVIAAILTPTPDVVNQVMMAAPLVVLYEISIVAVRLFGRTMKGENGKGKE